MILVRARRAADRRSDTRALFIISFLMKFLLEHIMNKLIRASPKRWLSVQAECEAAPPVRGERGPGR